MKYIMLISLLLLLLVSNVHGYQINSGNGTITISSGDNAVLTGTITDGSRSGYLWLYTGNYDTLIYGEPIIISGNTYKININKSTSLSNNKYKIFVQFAGKNDIQEVLFDKPYSKLYSPWIYPKVLDVSGTIAAVPNLIENYCNDNKKYCDDTFFNSTLIVEGSFIKFSEQYLVQNDEKDISKNGLLYIGGTTNIDPSNKITIILDYEQNVTGKIEEKNLYGYYIWYAYLNITKLHSGDHTILIRSNKISDLKSILTISEYIPTPTPTPTPIRYVGNEMKSFVVVTNAPIVRPIVTPMIVNSSNQQFVPIVTPSIETTPYIEATRPPQTDDIIVERTPLPAPSGAIFINPAVTNKIDYIPGPSTTSSKIPLDVSIVIVGLILAIIVLRKN